MLSLNDLKKTQRLFSSTPHEKMLVFEKPSLWMTSGQTVIRRWNNTQPLYFYPFSVLDFLHRGKSHWELRIIDSGERISKATIRRCAGSKVHFEKINPDLIQYAQKLKCKVSLICNLEDINDRNIGILQSVDLLIVRVASPQQDISVLKGIPNKRLLLGVRAYLSNSDNDFTQLVKDARALGIDFVHISKKLISSRQEAISANDTKKIISLSELQTDSFRVILPRDTTSVFNEKFVISEAYGNSRSCAFSKHRLVLFNDRFYPCYTRSILESGRFAATKIEYLHALSQKFGKTCTDCACIYENDLFDQISRASYGIKNKRFFLGYSKVGNNYYN